MRRRDFINKFGLSAGALVTAGIAGCGNGADTAQEQTGTAADTVAGKRSVARIQSYRDIGATGLKMSDISMGCGSLSNPYVVDHAIDIGINYFDTGPDYGSGGSEATLGKVFRQSSKRDKCIVASKFATKGKYSIHKMDPGTPVADIIEVVERSLNRLNTDHIEFMQVANIGEDDDDLDRLLDSELLSAMVKLKEQGKVLHLGLATHGPHDLAGYMIRAIESGHYGMIMPAMNFMEHPKLSDALAKAEEHSVGVVAMKTLAGARGEDLSKYKDENTSLAEAAFKWVFSHSAVSGLVISMNSVADVDLYVAASGKRFSAIDRKILDDYSGAVWSQYCRTGCGDCQSHCPHGVAVASVLRYDMYFSSYRDHLKALTEYRDLPEAMKPRACADCSGPCNAGCQFGVPVQARLLEAAERLEFA
jgi:predicted aldo/keto reductase-like oxidoreductase